MELGLLRETPKVDGDNKMSLIIGRISGIPIRLHYTWLIIFFLITWTVGFRLTPQQYPGLSQTSNLLIGLLSSLLLFGSILLHELSHSIVAKRSGLKIRQITLFIFGGVAEMEGEAKEPGLELRMAAAGPLTSIALAIMAGVIWQASILVQASALIQAPLQYATLVNGVVAVFNLIPAFPMDGGRIFRSLIWRRRGDLLSATKTAATVGRGFAYLLMFGGALMIFTVNFITGLWLVLIGWFIQSGARSSLEQTIMGEALRGSSVSDIMTREVDSVTPTTTVEELSQEFLRLKHNGFPVMSDGKLEGCVTFEDMRKVPRESWIATRIRDIMTPRGKLITIEPQKSATEGMLLMARSQIGRLLVLDQERLVGIISRSDIMKTVMIKSGPV